MRAGGHLAALVDAHPLARDARVLHDERDELLRRPFGLDPAQFLDPRELGVERAHPAEPGRDRVRVWPDVVAVQRVADLEPQGVPRSEAARPGAALDDRVPEGDGVLGHDHQLDAFLTGVARAIDHHLDAAHLAHLPGEGRALVEADALQRSGSLDGEERELVGLVAQVGPGAGAAHDPLEVGLAVRRVDDEQEPA